MSDESFTYHLMKGHSITENIYIIDGIPPLLIVSFDDGSYIH
jgi:hypothetical protein